MSALASVYAKALTDCFSDRPKEDFFAVLRELKQLNKCFHSSEARNFFLSPAFPLALKKKTLKKIFSSRALSDITCAFLFLLLDKKRWKELQSILDHLTDREENLKGILRAEVESSATLSLKVKESLTKKLEGFFNKKIVLQEKPPNKNLIAGLKVRAGGLVFDDAFLFHLDSMENQIRRNFYDYTSE